MNPTFETSGIANSSTATGTIGLTLGSNSNRVLISFSNCNEKDSITPSLGGISFTPISSSIGDNLTQRSQVFMYFSPPTGSQTVTYTRTIISGGGNPYSFTCFSYYNVNQTFPDSSVIYATPGTSIENGHTISTTPVVANSLFWGAGTYDSIATPLTSGLTHNQTSNSGVTGGGIIAGDNGLVSTTTSWSQGGTSQFYNQVAITLAPSQPIVGGAFLYQMLN